MPKKEKKIIELEFTKGVLLNIDKSSCWKDFRIKAENGKIYELDNC